MSHGPSGVAPLVHAVQRRGKELLWLMRKNITDSPVGARTTVGSCENAGHTSPPPPPPVFVFVYGPSGADAVACTMCEFVRHALIPQWDSISLANIVYEAEAEEEEEEEDASTEPPQKLVLGRLNPLRTAVGRSSRVSHRAPLHAASHTQWPLLLLLHTPFNEQSIAFVHRETAGGIAPLVTPTIVVQSICRHTEEVPPASSQPKH